MKLLDIFLFVELLSYHSPPSTRYLQPLSVKMDGIDLSLTPAGYPPPGVAPNFVNPTSLAPTTIGVFAALISLAALAVSARVIFNFSSTRKLGADDSEFSTHSNTVYCKLLMHILVSSIGALIFSVAQSAIVLSCKSIVFSSQSF
jgi:hypothetical protein